jgi:hypothetical protein
VSVPLGEVYDDVTLARLDAAVVPPRFDPRPASGLRGRAAAGALVTALALGAQDVLGPSRPREVIEEVAPAMPAGPGQWVVYIHVAGAPKACVALVRP